MSKPFVALDEWLIKSGKENFVFLLKISRPDKGQKGRHYLGMKLSREKLWRQKQLFELGPQKMWQMT